MASSNSKISSGLNLTSDFYLKNFYRHNRNVIKSSARDDYSKAELSYEDSRALKRAIAKLGSFDYTGDENGSNIVSSIHAFIKTYNHAIDSSSSSSSDSYRQNRQLKALTQKYSSELKDIGISIESNGTLSVSENILKGSSIKEIRKVFSEESGYLQSIGNISKRMNRSSYDEIYSQITGNGKRLNITL